VLELFFYALAGAGVGLAIGMTGVGGGSLMTPLLVIGGNPLGIAIGTDLMYAAVTKGGAVYAHHRQGTILWRISLLLGLGSIPASMLTAFSLYLFFDEPEEYQDLLRISLGGMLLVTSSFLLLRPGFQRISSHRRQASDTGILGQHQNMVTILVGVILGVLVTLTSVGAGVFGTMTLFLLYPHMKAVEVVGTELAHAVPLTLVAGMGHWIFLGNIKWLLLLGLLAGSLPAVWLGSRLSARMPQETLRFILIFALSALGIYFIVGTF